MFSSTANLKLENKLNSASIKSANSNLKIKIKHLVVQPSTQRKVDLYERYS